MQHTEPKETCAACIASGRIKRKSSDIEARQQERGLRMPEEFPAGAGSPGDDPLAGRRVRHPESAQFHRLLAEIGVLHDRKQADYGSATDPFANVRAASELGVRPWIAALVRMSDKMSRLKAAARGQPLQNETVRDTFLDLAVYSLIALLLHEEDCGER